MEYSKYSNSSWLHWERKEYTIIANTQAIVCNRWINQFFYLYTFRPSMIQIFELIKYFYLFRAGYFFKIFAYDSLTPKNYFILHI